MKPKLLNVYTYEGKLVAQEDISDFSLPELIHLLGILDDTGRRYEWQEDERGSKMKLTKRTRFKIQKAIFDSMHECGSCGEYHPRDWHGDCREDDFRYHPEDLASRLFAAPDLLGALEDIANRLAPGSPDIESHHLLDIRETAKQAIARAKA